MYFDFAAILLIATVITGVIWLLWLLLTPKTKRSQPAPKLVEYSRSFFPVLLVVFLLRAFVAEPYRIPSGSMKPSLLEGDFILVNKYTYGVRMPITAQKIFPLHNPERGDVLVFRYPNNPKINFIKRVVGLPGDTIEYNNKTLYINGKAANTELIGQDIDQDIFGKIWQVKRYQENLNSTEHEVFIRNYPTHEQAKITVPEGAYFVMGDNRDNSEDSRVWGFVPDKLIVGKAFMVWLSWDKLHKDIRWQRTFSVIR